MKKKLFVVALALCAVAASQAQVTPKRELRGVWLTTHLSLDWPNRTQTPTQQQAALRTILDHNKATGMNSVFFQVRSQSDAMYPSSIEPWSYYLTGTQGTAPNPAWDPLQYAIDESRKRGFEFHAWINPYRAVSDATASNDPLKYAANHVSRQHPEWLLTLGNVKILNPGLPQVRDYIHGIVLDIVQRYDIDGLHFDDYFYQTGTILDDAAYNADPRGFANTTAGRADWRRDNVSLLIDRIGASIRALKPWVKFGISPSGIYFSDPAYPNGTPNPAVGSWTSTGAFQHYRNSYADTRLWLQQGWIDYLAPQLYWYIGQPGSDYQMLLPWWDQNTFGRHMYIGLADYKVGAPPTGTPWYDANPNNQIVKQIGMNRAAVNVGGQVHFRHAFLNANPLGYRTELMNTLYKRPALLPTMPWKTTLAPAMPQALKAAPSSGGALQLTWTAPPAGSTEFDKVRRYAVYRSPQWPINVEDPAHLLGLTSAEETSYIDATRVAGNHYFYVVTGLNRLHNESSASNGARDCSIAGAAPQPAIAITRSANTGFPPNTVTLGIGPQSLTLTAADQASGSTSSFTWTPAPHLSGTNGAVASFTPTAAGSFTYTVRLANQYGCTADGTVTVIAVDKRRGR